MPFFPHKIILCSLSKIFIPKTINLKSFQQIIIIQHSYIKLARCREEEQVLKKFQELATPHLFSYQKKKIVYFFFFVSIHFTVDLKSLVYILICNYFICTIIFHKIDKNHYNFCLFILQQAVL